MVMLLNISIVRPNYRQTVSDGANGILRNTTTAMPLKKYLRDQSKCHRLNAKSNENLGEQIYVFCQQLVLIMMMLILILFFF